MKKQKKILSGLFTLASISAILMGCGSKVTGTWTVTQQGGAFSTGNPACAQITLNMQENGNNINGNGSNACGTETLIGTISNGVITVTSLTFIPSTGGGASQYGYNSYGNNSYGMNYTYQGTLTISGNTITGQLTGNGGQVIVNGTKN